MFVHILILRIIDGPTCMGGLSKSRREGRFFTLYTEQQHEAREPDAATRRGEVNYTQEIGLVLRERVTRMIINLRQRPCPLGLLPRLHL
jgi:hypothetical protein